MKFCNTCEKRLLRVLVEIEIESVLTFFLTLLEIHHTRYLVTRYYAATAPVKLFSVVAARCSDL